MREMTSEKVCKFGEYELFGHLLFKVLVLRVVVVVVVRVFVCFAFLGLFCFGKVRYGL